MQKKVMTDGIRINHISFSVKSASIEYRLDHFMHPLMLTTIGNASRRALCLDDQKNRPEFVQSIYEMKNILKNYPFNRIQQIGLDLDSLLVCDPARLVLNEEELNLSLNQSRANNSDFLNYNLFCEKFLRSSAQVLVFGSAEHCNYWDYLLLIKYLKNLKERGFDSIIIEGLSEKLQPDFDYLKRKFAKLSPLNRENIFAEYISNNLNLYDIAEPGKASGSGIVLTSLIRQLIFEAFSNQYRVICPGFSDGNAARYANELKETNEKIVGLTKNVLRKSGKTLIFIGAAHLDNEYGLLELFDKNMISWSGLKMLTTKEQRQKNEQWRLTQEDNLFFLKRVIGGASHNG